MPKSKEGLFRFKFIIIGRILRDSLFFHPAVGILLGILSPILALPFASLLPYAFIRLLPTPNPEALREILKILAASMLTILSLTVSVFIVVLNVISSQYSPRLVRAMMRNQVSQWTLAIFLATVGFSLAGSLTIESDMNRSLVTVMTHKP